MITVISGTDQDKILDFVKSRKAIAKDSKMSCYEFSLPNDSISDVLDTIYSSSIFTVGDIHEKKLILINLGKIGSLKFDDTTLVELKQNELIDLFVVVSSTKNKSYEKNNYRNTKTYKNLLKYSKELKFDLPKDYTYFNLSDAIFIDRDVKKALKILNTIDDVEANVFSIIATLQNTLRSYVSMKYNNDTYKKLHPFVKKKLTDIKMSKTDVDRVYMKLCHLDYNVKNQNRNTLFVMQDFLIYLW